MFPEEAMFLYEIVPVIHYNACQATSIVDADELVP